MVSRNPLDPLVSAPSASQTPRNRHNKGRSTCEGSTVPLFRQGSTSGLVILKPCGKIGSLVQCHLTKFALKIFHGAQ